MWGCGGSEYVRVWMVRGGVTRVAPGYVSVKAEGSLLTGDFGIVAAAQLLKHFKRVWGRVSLHEMCLM